MAEMNPGNAPTYPVAIVGAGPVGLSLALGLARYGIRSAVFEKNASTTTRSKAPGIHARTLEIFRQWNVLADVESAGILRSEIAIQDASDESTLLHFNLNVLSDEVETPAMCVLEQAVTEKVLLRAVQSSGLCDVFFNRRVVDVSQDHSGAKIWLDGSELLVAAQFVAGCDGAGSTVRSRLGLPFEGFTYGIEAMLADVRLGLDDAGIRWPRVHPGRDDFCMGIKLQDESWRVILLEPGDPAAITGDVDAEVIRMAVERLFDADRFETLWASAFRIHRRMAPRFRIGRVILAGDAAHINSPAGAQGMNTGIHDAHNLAWKLASALNGGDMDALLDSYETERRYVVEQHVNRITHFNTRAIVFAPRSLIALGFRLGRKLLSSPAFARVAARRVTMIQQPYGASALLGAAGKRVGHRVPNAVLRSPAGKSVRLFDLIGLHPAVLTLNVDSAGVEMPVNTVHVGKQGYRDASGVLSKFFGMRHGAAVIRPDQIVGWMSRDASADFILAGLEGALGRRLGTDRAAPSTNR